MEHRLDGKVAFITGAARGQGRQHALRLAEAGADIIALDLCAQIGTIAYPMSVPEDLELTATMVRATGRRIVTAIADVRDMEQTRAAAARGTAELGPIDIVIANAGISPLGSPEPNPAQTFADVVSTNLTGVWNTVHVCAPDMIERGAGGSIVITSSTQGLSGRGGDGTAACSGYAASKHGVVGLMRSFANWLSPHNIRVNTIHPNGVATPMVENDAMMGWIRGNPEGAAMLANLMPVEVMPPDDITNAVLFLVTDQGRYITGVTLSVDGGFNVR